MLKHKICHLTSVHSIRDPRIFHKECTSLARLGHDVALIACHEHAEVVDGIRIVPINPPRHRLDRMVRVGWQLYRTAARERADVYHFHDPELMWVGVLLKLGGSSVIYDVHEDVPKQIMSKPWIPAWARPLISRAAQIAEGLALKVLLVEFNLELHDHRVSHGRRRLGPSQAGLGSPLPR